MELDSNFWHVKILKNSIATWKFNYHRLYVQVTLDKLRGLKQKEDFLELFGWVRDLVLRFSLVMFLSNTKILQCPKITFKLPQVSVEKNHFSTLWNSSNQSRISLPQSIQNNTTLWCTPHPLNGQIEKFLTWMLEWSKKNNILRIFIQLTEVVDFELKTRHT